MKVRPAHFAAVYLTLTFGFAIWYYQIRLDFAYAHSGNDPVIRAQSGNCMARFDDAMRSLTLRAHPTGIVTQGAYSFDLSRIRSYLDDVREGTFHVVMQIPYMDETKSQQLVELPVTFEPLHIYIRPGSAGTAFVNVRLHEFAHNDPRLYGTFPLPRDVFSATRDARGNELVFPDLDHDTLLGLVAYERATRGHPEYLPGAFSRALYFSVVTITTLGFGDIVPITDRARLSVALEAFLGIVTIGLFVNAVGIHTPRVRPNK
jgi:hypothetical protein